MNRGYTFSEALIVLTILVGVMLAPAFACANDEVTRAEDAMRRQDYPNAMKWYREAAMQEDAIAQNQLGWLYYKGLGISQDHAEALTWFRKAARQGYAEAQYNLGQMLYLQMGMSGNQDAEALEWFLNAAEQGHVEAQYSVGMLYYNGSGAAADYFKAAKWLQQAADHDHAGAQNQMGVIYEYGQGVILDYTKSRKWYQKAADQEYSVAKDNLNRLEQKSRLPRQPGDALSQLERASAEEYRKHEMAQQRQRELGRCYDRCSNVESFCKSTCEVGTLIGFALILTGTIRGDPSFASCSGSCRGSTLECIDECGKTDD